MTGITPADDGREYPLADIIHRLGEQLAKANERVVAEGRRGRLKWTEATVELGVTWEKTSDGGLDLKVVRLGGGVTKANTTTMTVKVVPLGPDEGSAIELPDVADLGTINDPDDSGPDADPGRMW